jgi:hypothetical protein
VLTIPDGRASSTPASRFPVQSPAVSCGAFLLGTLGVDLNDLGHAAVENDVTPACGAMVDTAERHRELVAYFAAERTRLREPKMMGIRALPPADQAGLSGDELKVLLVPAWTAPRSGASRSSCRRSRRTPIFQRSGRALGQPDEVRRDRDRRQSERRDPRAGAASDVIVAQLKHASAARRLRVIDQSRINPPSRNL